MTEERAAGKSLVEDIMSTKVHSVDPSSSVKDVAQYMAKEGHGCVLVVSGQMAVGIITERDIVHKITAEGIDPRKIRASDIMSTPLVTISPEATIGEAAERMSSFGIRRIVVTDKSGGLLGLLTAGDLAKWLAEEKGYADATLNAIARLKSTGVGGPYR